MNVLLTIVLAAADEDAVYTHEKIRSAVLQFNEFEFKITPKAASWLVAANVSQSHAFPDWVTPVKKPGLLLPIPPRTKYRQAMRRSYRLTGLIITASLFSLVFMRKLSRIA